LYEELIEKFEKLKKEYDFILIEGEANNLFSAIVDFDINLVLSIHFNTPIVGVINGENKNKKTILQELDIWHNSIQKHNCIMFATFVNRIKKSKIKQLKKIVANYQYDILFMPQVNKLEKLTMLNLHNLSNKDLVFGNKKDLNSYIKKIKIQLIHKNHVKIALILALFSKYVDTKKIKRMLNLAKPDIMSPIMFELSIFEKASKDKKHIVLNESYDERILKACEILLHRNIVNITLIGDENKIFHKCKELGVNIKGATIVNPKTSKITQRLIESFYQLRSEKGVTLSTARDIMLSSDIYFATMMVYLGYVDAMVSGAVGTTANTIRPALQIIKTKPNIDIVSSVFFMCFDTKVLVYADCAINPFPNYKELAQIAISSAKTAKIFDIESKIAMLSYSTGNSGSSNNVENVAKATELITQLDKTLFVEGPIQYDAAIDAQVAFKKLPNSKLKGKATIFIFPDLNTGNNTYKAVQRSSDVVAIGPILQGLNKPVNDLSRGCKVVDIVNTIAITAIQAGNNNI
jgi:phosphate acetyltransferase